MRGAWVWLSCVATAAACFSDPLELLGFDMQPAATVDAGADVGVGVDMAGQPMREQGPALSLHVRGSDDLQPLPARVIVAAVPPTSAYDVHKDGATAKTLTPDLIGITDGVLLSTGEALLPIAPGTYDLTILQGPEYEQVRRRVTVGDTEAVRVDVVLEHSVRTRGWLAADMHIHTSRSYDSKLLPFHRVVSEVAAGVKLLVPTDHVWHNDLQSYVEALGYTDRAVAIAGSEYGFKFGHLGVYPVEFDPKGALWGAPPWAAYENWGNLTPDVAFPMIHGLPRQPVVVVNHPRLLPDLGYFTNIGWPHTPDEPLSSAGLFDGMEVLNGYASGPEEITALLRDWFFLLGQGYRIAGLGNSDTHRMDWLTSGYPRTWLRLPTDEPKRVLPSDLREAVIGMRAVASSGPWLHMLVDGQPIGETVQVRAGAGSVTVDIEADAPSWIDLSHVLLYQNGVLVKDWSVPALARPHPALAVQVSLPVAADGWLVAMAIGEQPLPVSVIGAVRSGLARPFAVTNPVWLDQDGDGKVQPPRMPGGAGPQPFGSPRHLVGAEEPLAPTVSLSSAGLHAPLDCEPDTYLEWLERSAARK